MAVGTGTAILGSAAVGAGTSLLGGLFGSDSSSSAARAQARAYTAANRTARQTAAQSRQAANYATKMQAQIADRQLDLYSDMFNRQVQLASPWIKSGKWGLNKLQDRIAAGPGKYKESPDYSLRLSEALDTINANASTKGLLQSGPTLKALTKYSQDYASTDYDKFLNRYYQSLTPYQSLAGLGQTSASNLSGTGSSTASGMSSALSGLSSGYGSAANLLSNSYTNLASLLSGNTTSAGNARASSYINSANSWGSALGGLSNNLLMMPFLYNMYGNSGSSSSGYIPSDSYANDWVW